jgi:hypothetical protein
MNKSVPMLMLPLVLLAGACADEVPVANDGDVVLNDSYDNMAFSNDGEDPANAGASAGTTDGTMTGDHAMDGHDMNGHVMTGNSMDSSGTMSGGNMTTPPADGAAQNR